MSKQGTSRIFIIDDDDSVRKGLSLLLKSAGYEAETYDSIAGFLERDATDQPSCILLDVFMDNESGLEWLDSVVRKFACSPVIFVTGFGDIPMSVHALKRGAINFLQKPVDDGLLLSAIEEALQKSRKLLEANQEISELKTRVNALTPREFEIFRFVVKGFLNKQIAHQLNIAEHTVKLHRGKVTEKLGVKNVAELIQIADKLQLQA